MALVTKMIRCAKCGSSEVVYDGKAVYHCAACGMDCDHAMPAADLAEALAAKGIELDRKVIVVDAIKTVGEYEAVAKLHKEVKAVIKFSVTAAE